MTRTRPRDPWPTTREALVRLQTELGAIKAEPWTPAGLDDLVVAACFVCFGRGGDGPGHAGDPGWAAAVLWQRRTGVLGSAVRRGAAGAAYEPGLLALREGRLLAEALTSLPSTPDVLLVNGTGRDHPRRFGLACHLGWALALPSVGVTHRPLVAHGDWPSEERGTRSPLTLDGARVGYWVRARPGARPLAAHVGWRTSPELAADLLLHASWRRTPEPLRLARMLARSARARDLA